MSLLSLVLFVWLCILFVVCVFCYVPDLLLVSVDMFGLLEALAVCLLVVSFVFVRRCCFVVVAALVAS